MGKYFQKLERRNRMLSLKSSNDRVLQFLYGWVKDYGERVGWETLVRQVLHHSQIALMTNTSRQTVTTTFNDLRRAGIIHYTRRYLIIREMEKLEELVRKV